MTDLEVLQCVRQHLADPLAWHQGGWFAERPFDHWDVEIQRAAAATYCAACLGGWLARVTGEEPWNYHSLIVHGSQFSRLENKLQRGLEDIFFKPDLDVSCPHIFEWNDDIKTEHKDVLKVLDWAIERELKP